MERVARLGGSSVHMDKFFMMKYMPRLINHLHHRQGAIAFYLTIYYLY